jgi:uncharacterized protein (TIGR03435 family)
MKPTLLVLLSCVAFAQTNVQTPAFDVTDVHPSKPGSTTHQFGMLPGSGLLEFRGISLSELIQFAYSIDDDLILEPPKWLGFTQFDGFGKCPRGTSDDTVKLMLRSMLADRFNLVFHTTEKPAPAFVLTAGKKVLMKPAPETEETDCQPKPGVRSDGPAWECRNVTMKSFAERIHQYANGYLPHPVIDQTGLTGGYDFALQWTGRGNWETNHEGTTVFEAVEKQLGLKLEEKKVPVPAMLIESANETPTPNAPDVTENAPATATEFEVSEIKKSAPDVKPGGGFKPGGRIDIQALTIKDILPFVFDVDANQLVGIPKWMETDRFSIVAKPPGQVGMDSLKVMLLNLFIQSFKMETHKEQQPVSVYVMTVSKHGLKLQKSSAAEAQGCKQGSPIEFMTHWICKATTLKQFGEQFHQYAPGYLDHSVVDETGVTDAFDFEISWTPRGKIDAMRAKVPSADASDPSGLTFFEAAEKLGVKFESQKRPMQVIVIDKATPPADN